MSLQTATNLPKIAWVSFHVPAHFFPSIDSPLVYVFQLDGTDYPYRDWVFEMDDWPAHESIRESGDCLGLRGLIAHDGCPINFPCLKFGFGM